jgi:hypothetical protein
MNAKWPSKAEREQFEINEFISAYEWRSLVVESKGEKPDYILRDTKSGELIGVELTAVYLDDRSVPDEHMKPSQGWETIQYSPELISLYKKRLIKKLIETHEDVFDNIVPFAEIFFMGLPYNQALSVRAK